jgi:hypothetical protein
MENVGIFGPYVNEKRTNRLMIWQSSSVREQTLRIRGHRTPSWGLVRIGGYCLDNVEQYLRSGNDHTGLHAPIYPLSAVGHTLPS